MKRKTPRIPKQVEVGQIFKAETSFFAFNNNIGGGRKKMTEVLDGDFLEIRYPFKWHFRLQTGEYLNCPERTLLNNCSLFGVIYNDVRSENEKKLADILKENLFTGINEMVFNQHYDNKKEK